MSKPKYMEGDCIRSLDDLVLQENIYWNRRIWNRKWFMNLQIQTLLSLIKHKALQYAVRRDGSTTGEFVEPVLWHMRYGLDVGGQKMDAVEFLKQYSRMVASGVQPFAVPSSLPYEEIVRCVEQWAKEHPVKTRKSEFLKMFPNARIESDGMPSICPIVVDKRCHNKDDDALFCLVRDEEECRKCRRDFWLAEISEGKACE